MTASVFNSQITFNAWATRLSAGNAADPTLAVDSVLLLQTLEASYLHEIDSLVIVNGSVPDSSPNAIELMALPDNATLILTLPSGGWISLLSPNVSATHILFNVEKSSLNITVANPKPKIKGTLDAWISVSVGYQSANPY
jgi:hypothetical protein